MIEVVDHIPEFYNFLFEGITSNSWQVAVRCFGFNRSYPGSTMMQIVRVKMLLFVPSRRGRCMGDQASGKTTSRVKFQASLLLTALLRLFHKTQRHNTKISYSKTRKVRPEYNYAE